MKIFQTPAQYRAYRSGRTIESVGLVPTMGALHEGHLSLVRACVRECQAAVVSIFINPAQFDRPDDLEHYPRRIEKDVSLLSACGVETVLLPGFDDIYPDNYSYRVSESQLSHRFCGAYREGHFDGVLTVVMRLLNIVGPDRAYFGEKDYQQLQLIRGMVNAFFMDVEIVGCPIIREPDGLAKSSRNRLLTPEHRELAGLLNTVISATGDAGPMRSELEEKGFVVDYIEEFEGRRLAAVTLGKIRLIDNVSIS